MLTKQGSAGLTHTGMALNRSAALPPELSLPSSSMSLCGSSLQD
jgi:hypothetical protein